MQICLCQALEGTSPPYSIQAAQRSTTGSQRACNHSQHLWWRWIWTPRQCRIICVRRPERGRELPDAVQAAQQPIAGWHGLPIITHESPSRLAVQLHQRAAQHCGVQAGSRSSCSKMSWPHDASCTAEGLAPAVHACLLCRWHHASTAPCFQHSSAITLSMHRAY